jgi:putative ABC transport system permease protein
MASSRGLRIRLLRGRFFTPEDRPDSEAVAVVTDAFSRKFFAGDDALNHRIRVHQDGKNQWARIVGVAADIRDQSLDVEPRPIYFLSHRQTAETIGGSMRQVTFVLQTAVDAATLAPTVRAAVRSLDPALPPYDARTYDAAISSAVAQPRFAALLLSSLAAFGLALGAIGVYGVLAFTVTERTHEIGLRRALGAPTSQLVRMILAQGLTPALAGIVVGLITALAARDVIRTQLFGISPTDTGTYLAVAVGVMIAALVACLVPLTRALRVSPATALRES